MPEDLKQIKQEKDERFVESAMTMFELELRGLVNKHSLDTVFDIPDFLIAEYVTNIMRKNYDCLKKLTKWRGHGLEG